jgi:hypothetical protein
VREEIGRRCFQYVLRTFDEARLAKRVLMVLRTVVVVAMMMALALPTSVGAADADRLVTGSAAGPVRLGMTVANVRTVMPGVILERTQDGEGLALISVRRGEDELMTLYAGEDDPETDVDEKRKVEFIQVWDPIFVTAEGVHAEMPLSEAERHLGRLTEVVLSEIEMREFAEFTKKTPGIQYRVISEDGFAGIYPEEVPEGAGTTKRYRPDARILAIEIVGPTQ